jgi:hypothetical protein
MAGFSIVFVTLPEGIHEYQQFKVSVFKITTLAFGVKTNWNGQCSSHA